jgi:tRNA threonylcarbamoyladenosine biosynthesis protein TsaB
LLAEAEVALSDMDAIAFSRGPGSFTSLRIGIGVVQGLAWGADLPVLPVSSLRVTAQEAAKRGVSKALVAMDARMNEVYCGRFGLENGLMQPLDDEQVAPAEMALRGPMAGFTGVGNGFERFAELAAADREALVDVWPSAQSLAVLAEAQWRTEGGLPAELAQPVYLRNKVAEKSAPKPAP